MQFEAIESLPARVRTIATLRGLGYSFRAIGSYFSITPQAVSLMLARHRRVLKNFDATPEFRELSCRAVNALGRHGIMSREDARRVNALEILRGERNCGSKTLEEIERWISAGHQTVDGARHAVSREARGSSAIAA